MTTVYRLDRRFALQLFGWRMILAGAFALVGFLALSFGGYSRGIGVICAAIAVLLVLAAAHAMARPPLVAALNAQGFRLGRVAEGAIRKGHWTTVAKVNTEHGRLVFTLESGETGSVALILVPRRADELQRDVHARLNTAHGYRPLN